MKSNQKWGKQIMKHSTKLTQALLSLMMSLGSQAFAKDQSIISETILKNNLDETIIQELISEKILFLFYNPITDHGLLPKILMKYLRLGR